MFRALENRHLTGALAALVFVFSSLIYAQDSLRLPPSIQPPFDVKEVVRQFRQAPSGNLVEPPTFLLDTFAAYVPALDFQDRPAIAFDGCNYFVVWQDSRTGYMYQDIYGARVDRNGRVLDRAGIVVCRKPQHQTNPRVAFDGNNYLVVWQDARNGSALDIFGSRISPAGVLLDKEGIAISTAANVQTSPSVAFDGANFLVVWQDSRRSDSTADIYATRVDPAGVVLDPLGILVSSAVGDQTRPSTAFDGTNYLVIWQDFRNDTLYGDIYAARISRLGTVLEPSGIPISVAAGDQRCPAVAFGVTDFLVVWTDQRNSDSGDVYGARVSQTGVVLDTGGLAISALVNRQEWPSVTFDGGSYFVVWHDERVVARKFDIYGARVTQSGMITDTGGIVVSNVGSNEMVPAVAFDGNNHLVAWRDYRGETGWGGGLDIYGARVTRAGDVIDSGGILMSLAANDQRYPSIAFGDVNYLISWQDWRGNSFDIYGTRATSLGSLVDDRGFPISTADGWQWYPSVASDGTDYFVVWQDHRASASNGDIYGARVSSSGVVLDSEGIAITASANDQRTPAIAFDGRNYFVIWRELGVIYGSRIDRSGRVIDTNAVLLGVAARAPSVTFGDTNYLAVWSGFQNIYGARVTPEGVDLDPGGILICAAAGDQNLPQVAFDGSVFMVVWQDPRSGSLDIYCSRVGQNGTVLDPNGIAVSTGQGNQASPAIAFDGNNYVIMWEDYRNNAYGDIYGARVSRSGVVVDSFAVFNEATAELVPAIVYGKDGRCLVAYYGWTDSLKNHPAHTFRIWGLLTEEITSVEAVRPGPDFGKILEILPNPFRGQTKIELGAGHGAKSMELKIFDVSGRVVRQFNHLTTQPFNQVAWDGADDRGLQLPAGVYFCVLKSENDLVSRKVVKLE